MLELFALAAAVIVFFVWKSTHVREIHDVPSLVNFPTTFGVRRSSSIISNASTSSTIEENLTSSVEDIAENIFAEASESYRSTSSASNNNFLNNEARETEQDLIIRAMDRDMSPIRPNNNNNNSGSNGTSRELAGTSSSVVNDSELKDEDKISIKLKYLNDDIKIVAAYLNESVGNFKKRNFKAELESKLVKLIFNGKLLEDDKKSLSESGIYSDAVVHCLLIPKRNNPVTNQNANVGSRGASNLINNVTLERWNGTIFIYVVGMVVCMITLGFCWYARIQYATYFSWYSTIGLILMTSLFIVMVPLFSISMNVST